MIVTIPMAFSIIHLSQFIPIIVYLRLLMPFLGSFAQLPTIKQPFVLRHPPAIASSGLR
ncbi:MAG: hypothetical protein GY805_11250 [Chloroflexi bacterium]|nr:hypothetical protein [Chloroflexota bacterium]